MVFAAVQSGEVALNFVSKDIQIDTEFVLGVCRTLADTNSDRRYRLLHTWIKNLPLTQKKKAQDVLRALSSKRNGDDS